MTIHTTHRRRILNTLLIAIVLMPLLCSLAIFGVSHGQTAPPMPPPEAYHGDPPHPHLQVFATCRPEEDAAYYTVTNQGNADLVGAKAWLLPDNTTENLPLIWPNGFLIIKGQRPSSIYVWKPNDPAVPFVYAECGPAHKIRLHLPFLSNGIATTPTDAGR